ncbi:hypothetical protein Drorol1_Dr00008730 [Drosera rotundifolia]
MQAPPNVGAIISKLHPPPQPPPPQPQPQPKPPLPAAALDRGCDISKIWPTYFPETVLSIRDWRPALISRLACFFATPRGQQIVSQVQEEDGLYSLPLDFEHFRNICDLKDLYENMEEHPKEALLCLGAAIHKVKSSQDDKSEFEDNVKINIRLHNHPESMISLRNLKAAYIDRLVSVRGTVVKASTVRPLVVQMTFKCAGCGANIPRLFPGGKFSPPVICDMRACKSRTFFPIRSTVQAVDFQKIRLQELQKGENHEEGRVPRTVECELTEDLVDSCIPGDIVTVTGIIRQINNYADIGGGKSKTKLQGIFYLYLEAVSIKNSKSLSAAEGSQYSSVDDRATEMIGLFSFSPRDLEFIVKFSEEHGSDVFRQIIQSICPSIYGHELVKGVVCLSLFAGVRKHSVDQNKVPVRGDIHVIIVGDPGLGKSQLLQAAAAISPRGFIGSHGAAMCFCCKSWTYSKFVCKDFYLSCCKPSWWPLQDVKKPQPLGKK